METDAASETWILKNSQENQAKINNRDTRWWSAVQNLKYNFEDISVYKNENLFKKARGYKWPQKPNFSF